jgi:pulcherriminic acid synthase
MVPRRTRSEVQVSGGTIPAEAEVICFLASANRDERRFTNPDKYDILRNDLDAESAFNSAARHAAFGMGRHFCLGAMMARIEVEIAMERVLAFGADISFADEEPPPDQGLFLRGPAALPLRFEPTGVPQTDLRQSRN